jgi:uncharacterized Ntn-hydrolase superfamily protein
MTIQTFSIVGRSADGQQLGVAVASKFLAVGAYVPAAAVGAGAVATQALGNLQLKTRGLDMLASGVSARDMLQEFFTNDPQKDERQAGVVDAQGRAATFTGANCMPWAGGRAQEDASGSFAVQGNMLAGPEVVDAMAASWLSNKDMPLARRLVQALAAGQAAGGDPRGKQAAAVYVVGEGQGYGGLSDVAVDLRCDDAPDPIGELGRMLDLHDLYFGKTPAELLLDIDDSMRAQLAHLLLKVGFDTGDTAQDLWHWMGRENYEERWTDGKIDPVVLERLKLQAK